MKTYKGSCYCGGVTYEVDGPLRPSVACHCSQCRKTSGHYWSATAVPKERFRITKDMHLKSFQASPKAVRHFCDACGSSLFWEPLDEPNMSVASGTLDDPVGLTTSKHIFVEDKGCYYDIEAGPEQL